MKTERRHELQTIVLADWLGKKIIALEKYSRAAAGIVIALLIAVFVVFYFSKQQASRRATGWSKLFQGSVERDLTQMRETAEEHRGTEVGLWALQSAADLHLEEGSNLLYIDRVDAASRLSKAVSNYLLVVDQTKDSMLKRRALFGLAQAYEASNELKKAADRYAELAQLSPDSVLGKEAARRQEELNEEKTKKFYAWFFTQKPRRSQPPVRRPAVSPTSPKQGDSGFDGSSDLLNSNDQTFGERIGLDLDEPVTDKEGSDAGEDDGAFSDTASDSDGRTAHPKDPDGPPDAADTTPQEEPSKSRLKAE